MSPSDDWYQVQTEKLFLKRLKPIEAYNPELSDDRGLIAWKDIDVMSTVDLESLQRDQNSSEHALPALLALLKSNDLGIYPPLWALDEIYKRLQEYTGPTSNKSLDEIFGLAAKGKGKESALTTLHREKVLERVFLRMWRLQNIFGLTVNQSAQMEVRRLAETDWKSGMNLRDFSIGTLESYYNHSKFVKSLPAEALTKLRAELSEAELKEKYLADYPEDCIPNWLK